MRTWAAPEHRGERPRGSRTFARPSSELVRGPGVPLDARTRSSMERRFGRRFGDVRIHADGAAAASAASIGAEAYTVGRHVVFGARRYEPHTVRGAALLEHELGHVIQQPEAEPRGALRIAPRHDPAELDAQRFRPSHRAPPGMVYRQTREDWQDAGAGRPRPGAALDVERLLAEHPDVAVNEILVYVFLEISRREVARTLPSGKLAYAQGEKLQIAFSGAESVVAYHCTDLVMNSAWAAGFQVPHGRRFWEKSTATLARVSHGRDKLLARVPVPADDPRTRIDERKRHLRAGDVMVWGADEPGGYGHQMIIVSPGPVGGQVTVREAGVEVREGASRQLDPAGRDEAVYRFLTFDAMRISRSYTSDLAYRALFHEAFERCSLAPDVKGRYRR